MFEEVQHNSANYASQYEAEEMAKLLAKEKNREERIAEIDRNLLGPY